jgi:hypothetical protein
MAALRSLTEDEWYDRVEAVGEWRALLGAPDVTEDEFWTLAHGPGVLPPEKEEVEF